MIDARVREFLARTRSPDLSSARLTKLFDSVKGKVVGQLALTISHPGEILIDGKPYAIPTEAHPAAWMCE